MTTLCKLHDAFLPCHMSRFPGLAIVVNFEIQRYTTSINLNNDNIVQIRAVGSGCHFFHRHIVSPLFNVTEVHDFYFHILWSCRSRFGKVSKVIDLRYFIGSHRFFYVLVKTVSGHECMPRFKVFQHNFTGIYGFTICTISVSRAQFLFWAKQLSNQINILVASRASFDRRNFIVEHVMSSCFLPLISSCQRIGTTRLFLMNQLGRKSSCTHKFYMQILQY